MKIPKKLKKEIKDYCVLNNITDIETFMLDAVKQGFNIEKYGNAPFDLSKPPEIVEKEVEKIVEIIKEVEKIIEVPIEKIVEKEVEIIVEVPVTDDAYSKKLKLDIDELSQKIVSLEKQLGDEKKSVEDLSNSDGSLVKNLNNKIKDLKIKLELEKNRNIKPKKKIHEVEPPPKVGLDNVINWISKSERTDLYDD